MTCTVCHAAPALAVTVGRAGFDARIFSEDGRTLAGMPITAPVADRAWCARCWCARFGGEHAA